MKAAYFQVSDIFVFTRIIKGQVLGIQRDITPYRAHAHKRYSSMNRVPEHDFPFFLVLHRTECKPTKCILNRVTVVVVVRVRVRV